MNRKKIQQQVSEHMNLKACGRKLWLAIASKTFQEKVSLYLQM